jgi:hypothetical protein
MTGTVILNVVLAATAVAGIVSLARWSIVVTMNRAGGRRARSHRTSRRYCMPEVHASRDGRE